MMARTWTELRSLSDEELIAEHDKLAQLTGVGLGYYLEEMRFRHLNRDSERMLNYTQTILGYTKWVKWMTVIITVATIISVVVVLTLGSK